MPVTGRTCSPVMTSLRKNTPIQTTMAFFTVPSTLRVRLLVVWITTYASALTQNPMAAADMYSIGLACSSKTVLIDPGWGGVGGVGLLWDKNPKFWE